MAVSRLVYIFRFGSFYFFTSMRVDLNCQNHLFTFLYYQLLLSFVSQQILSGSFRVVAPDSLLLGVTRLLSLFRPQGRYRGTLLRYRGTLYVVIEALYTDPSGAVEAEWSVGQWTH